MSITLLWGDCISRMQSMEENSVDGIVCDPPYGLEFMGKDWDDLKAVKHATRGNIQSHKRMPWEKSTAPKFNLPQPAFDLSADSNQRMQQWHEEWLAEAYRVLKPECKLKAFGGTRTFHRLAKAMEKVGFEEIGLEAFVYGSGFPKSLNIGKAIDKQGGRVTILKEHQDTLPTLIDLKKNLRQLFDASEKSRSQIDAECGFRACNYLSYPEEGKRPDPWFYVLPPQEKWEIIKSVLGIKKQQRLDLIFKEAEREVIGYKKAIPGVAFTSNGPNEIPITIPATEAAKTWEGWGTALKPAWEPILVGVKKK